MASQWFYKASDKEVGPVSGEELRNLAEHGTVTRDSPVRKAPDGVWVPAERVKGLFGSAADSPVQAAPTQQPISLPKETIEERLARLEKMIDSGAQLGGTTPLEGVTAREFRLVNAAGKTVALLGTAEGGSGLQLYDENGTPRAGLTLIADRPILTLADANSVRVSLGVVEEGPVLKLEDKTGNASIQLLCGDKGLVLELQNRVGAVRVLCCDNGPALFLEDGVGTVQAVLSISETGPNLALLNKNAEVGAELSVTEQGSYIGLRDGHGTTRAILSGRADRSGLAVFDEKGNITWHAP